MKYDITAKVFFIVFAKFFRNYYKIEFPEINTKQFLKATKQEYKAMIKRTPGLAKNNYLQPNLTMACFFFSLIKNVPDITPEIINKLIEFGLNSKFMSFINKPKRKKGTIFSEKEQNKRVKDAEKSQHSSYEMDWIYTYKKGKNDFYCTYTKCGICTLAKKEHMEKYVSCLCNLDYGNYKLMGGKLTRTKTLANGDECCDFYVTKIK